MKRYLIAVFLGGLLISGCATARLGTGPDVYSLKKYPAGTRVAVAKVADARGSDSAGMIGGCGIKIKAKELEALATNYLLDGMSRYFMTNISQVENVSAETVPQLASENDAAYFVSARIASLKMSSLDALLQPVEVSCDLDLKVYDRSGKEVLRKTFTGSYQERIGLSIVEKATGKLAERTVQNAVANLVKDTELQRLLKAE